MLPSSFQKGFPQVHSCRQWGEEQDGLRAHFPETLAAAKWRHSGNLLPAHAAGATRQLAAAGLIPVGAPPPHGKRRHQERPTARSEVQGWDLGHGTNRRGWWLLLGSVAPRKTRPGS